MLLHLANKMFANSLNIKSYIVLTIVFLFIQCSTQKFQLIKKNESYKEYSERNLPDGYIKLNLQQFYNCFFNFEFRGLPDYMSKPNVNYTYKIYEILIEEWCSTFKPWPVYKEDYTAKLIADHAEILKQCLGLEIQLRMSACFNNYFSFDVYHTKLTSKSKKQKMEKETNDCIDKNLETEENREKFKKCSIKFQKDLYFVRKDIRIEPRTLSTLRTAFGTYRSKSNFNDSITANFYEHKKDTVHKNADEKMNCKVNNGCKDFSKCQEENKNIKIFENEVKLFVSCIGKEMKITVRDCLSNNSKEDKINTCLNNDLTPSEKSKLLECSVSFEQKVSNYENKSSIKEERTDRPFVETADTVDFGTVCVIEQVFRSVKVNLETMYSNFTGFKRINWSLKERKTCVSKSSITSKVFQETLQEYQKFIKKDETLEQYKNRIINITTGTRLEKLRSLEQVLIGIGEEYNLFQSGDYAGVIEKDGYWNYMLRIKAQSEYIPLTKKLWMELRKEYGCEYE